MLWKHNFTGHTFFYACSLRKHKSRNAYWMFCSEIVNRTGKTVLKLIRNFMAVRRFHFESICCGARGITTSTLFVHFKQVTWIKCFKVWLFYFQIFKYFLMITLCCIWRIVTFLLILISLKRKFNITFWRYLFQ